MVRRLEALTTSEADEQRKDGNTEAIVKYGRREKLTVLQSSVERIERLQATVQRLTQAVNARDESVQALAYHLCGIVEAHSSHPRPSSTPPSSVLSLLPSATVRSLSLLDSQHTLYSSLFITGRCAMMLQEIGTRSILDANESATRTGSRNSIDRLAAMVVSLICCLCRCQLLLPHEWVESARSRSPLAFVSI